MKKDLILNTALPNQPMYDNTLKSLNPWADQLNQKLLSWHILCKERVLTIYDLKSIYTWIKQNIVLKDSEGMYFIVSKYAQKVPKAYKWNFMGDVVTFKVRNKKLIIDHIARDNVKDQKIIEVHGTQDQVLAFYKKYTLNNIKL